MPVKRELLFSLTKKDFKVQFFCASGAGGQNRNKVATACRIAHPDSGAVAVCKRHRTQEPNKKEAFTKLLETEKYKTWHKLRTARLMGKMKSKRQMMAEVKASMRPENLLVESF